MRLPSVRWGAVPRLRYDSRQKRYEIHASIDRHFLSTFAYLLWTS